MTGLCCGCQTGVRLDRSYRNVVSSRPDSASPVIAFHVIDDHRQLSAFADGLRNYMKSSGRDRSRG